MATRSSFNKNNSAVKRIMQEARELANDPSDEYSAAPLEEWHCTIRGPPDTDFEGGLYHLRIILPAEYPFRPPSLVMLTPSGRFETNTKICISFTNYHEELWQPAWGVRTAIIGLQGFFPLKGEAAMGVGSLEAPGSERRRLAKLSREWECPQCKMANHESLRAGGEASTGELGQGAHEKEKAKEEDGRTEPGASADGASGMDDVSQRGSQYSESVTPGEARSQAATSARRRPPLVLDAAISVLLVLVVALLCRKWL
ncbi:hypothetical protein M0805_009305 [Coniferiporia weirii]|nr:hypothetical protein M0805_009305 [Coniferiporia weirii]